jgi:hypothetical protein
MSERSSAAALAAVALVASLLAVLTIARYEALRDSVLDACPTAAALDLSTFADACKLVNYQQLVPEDLERRP